MLEATQASGEGLGQLSDGLARATTMREATDIGVRAGIENAAISNRMLQIMAADRARAADRSLRSASDYAETQRKNVDTREADRRPTFQGQEERRGGMLSKLAGARVRALHPSGRGETRPGEYFT